MWIHGLTLANLSPEENTENENFEYSSSDDEHDELNQSASLLLPLYVIKFCITLILLLQIYINWINLNSSTILNMYSFV